MVKEIILTVAQLIPIVGTFIALALIWLLVKYHDELRALWQSEIFNSTIQDEDTFQVLSIEVFDELVLGQSDQEFIYNAVLSLDDPILSLTLAPVNPLDLIKHVPAGHSERIR